MPPSPIDLFFRPLYPGGPHYALLYVDGRVRRTGLPFFIELLDGFFARFDEGMTPDRLEAGERMLVRELGADVAARIVADYQRALPHLDRYHHDGHNTVEEAQACYLRYLRDQYPAHLEADPLQHVLAGRRCG